MKTNRRNLEHKVLHLLMAVVLMLGLLPLVSAIPVAAATWETAPPSPEPAEVSVAGDTINMGVAGRAHFSSQNNGRHGATTVLPPCNSITVAFDYALSTWDSYNPLVDGAATGYWDSFSISVSQKKFWDPTLTLTDPLDTVPALKVGFLWGGQNWADDPIETNIGSAVVTMPASPTSTNYLNVMLDTATPPESNHNNPSWGTIKIKSIRLAIPSITPSSVTATIGMTTPPSSIVINKTVQTPVIPPKPDIVFLSDTTGSMSGAIANVQANLTSIMNQILTEDPNAQFAVAEYKDAENTGGGDPFDFKLNQAITSSQAAVIAAMATWVTDAYGGDEPEQQIYALDQIATLPTIGFRAGSTRIIVWMGDAPGHDPSMGITEIVATGALISGTNSPIRVIAVPVIRPGLDLTGQATRITAATGGLLMPGATPDQVADAILAGLTNLPITVSMTTNCVAPLSVTFVPASQTVISGSIVTFTETITLASNALPGIYEGDDWVLINGNPMTDTAGNIIMEHKTITARGPDLVITKSDSPDPVIVATDLTYIITVKNNGPSDATGVVVTDTLPAGVTFKSALPAPGSYNSGTGVWTLGNLANGGTATLTLVVNINAPAVDETVLANTVKITQCSPVDPDMTNNETTQTTKVLAPIIKVTKTDSLSGAVNPGDTIKYTTVITNSGNGPATGVIFTDTPDMNTTLVVGSVTTTPQGFVTKGNIAGNIVEVNVGTIAALSNVTVTFTVTVNKPLWEPQIVNQGIVKGATIVTLKTNDPDTALSDDPTVTLVKVSPPVHGPSISDWGIVALTLLLGSAMFRVIRRRENRI